MEWGQFLKYAYAGFVAVTIKWWSGQVITIIVGMFGGIELTSQGILSQCTNVLSVMSRGTGMASSIRAGRFLGQNRPDAATTAARMGLFVNGEFYARL